MKYENENYGRCENGKITAYAPSPLPWSKTHTETWTDEETGETHTDEWTEKKTIIHPTELEHNDMGWYRIELNKATPPAGQHVKSFTKQLVDNKIVNVYEYEDDPPAPPPPPRTFSILNFELACFKRGILDKVDEFIDSQSLTNEKNQTIPLRRAYDRANDFVEDNPYFSQFYSAGLAYIGYTAEQGEEILAESVVNE